MHEARIDDTPAGRLPADDGWWILNMGEIAWESAEGNGTFCVFEAPSAPSPVMGIGVHIVGPGEANGLHPGSSLQLRERRACARVLGSAHRQRYL